MDSTCVVRMEKGRSAFKMLTRTHTIKRLLGRRRRRWEGNIRMYLKEIGINMRNWVYSTQDRGYRRALMNASLKLRVPQPIELVITCNAIMFVLVLVKRTDFIAHLIV